jgi:hypothetical protein
MALHELRVVKLGGDSATMSTIEAHSDGGRGTGATYLVDREKAAYSSVGGGTWAVALLAIFIIVVIAVLLFWSIGIVGAAIVLRFHWFQPAGVRIWALWFPPAGHGIWALPLFAAILIAIMTILFFWLIVILGIAVVLRI